MELMWWALIIGAILGVALSAVFGIYSTKTSNSWSLSILGMNSGDLITDGIFLILAASVVFLATVAGLVRDVYYPMNRPWAFTAEVFLMAIPPALTFLVMVALRGYALTTADVWEKFAILILKFGLLHVLLQFSGFYSDILPPIKYA
jgi:hypothetical protein